MDQDSPNRPVPEATPGRFELLSQADTRTRLAVPRVPGHNRMQSVAGLSNTPVRANCTAAILWETLMSVARVLACLGLIGLGACSINPVPVTALPGPNKDYATYQKDETQCRAEASNAAYAPSGATNVNLVWQAFFTAYGKCEAARGNLIQPVPWGVAYQNYLGFGLPYPGVVY